MSSHILVTGASGFVGRVLCKELLKHNYSVRAAIRHDAAFCDGFDIVTTPSIDADTDWSVALLDVDAVVHLAARVHVMNDYESNSLEEFRKVNVDATLNLARQAFKSGVKRFIFVSSIKVNGELTQIDNPFTASDIACPQDAYGISKCEAEQGLLKLAGETGLEVVVIRPPLIYGGGVKANFASMIKAVKSGIPLPLGAINNKRSFVYIGNLISLILKCIDHPVAVNQVFLVSDGHDLSTTELLKACAQSLGVKSRLLPIPQNFLEFVAKVLGKRDLAQRLCGNLQVDITKTRQLLDWEPQFTVAEGLKDVVAGVQN
ncbi:UDP-glucose 4-epimerase family protein [Methylotenera sp. L2L1]|uniref:UDP-glucose 4-epimerase family protein n=1 Tax=Methylotenera sp. L2L1 TaxID=1502770 RepID=UPI0005652C5C|nr:SDR family oxidoreductase [Methylotenera sp. L2L1]